mmetsp:Transcript_1524/g.4624  ORF Transcript_1524/g.4624 Transcript_1524/m.4624 type:complete len:139 (-) Transcript_1524:59-475(-)
MLDRGCRTFVAATIYLPAVRMRPQSLFGKVEPGARAADEERRKIFRVDRGEGEFQGRTTSLWSFALVACMAPKSTFDFAHPRFTRRSSPLSLSQQLTRFDRLPWKPISSKMNFLFHLIRHVGVGSFIYLLGPLFSHGF